MTRREIWEALKRNDPDTAQFLIDLKKAFGQLENVKIVSHETKDEK